MSNATVQPVHTRSQRLYTNTILTLIAGLMLAMMLDRGQGALVSQASAQHQQPAAPARDAGDDSGMTNAAEQRKVMIAELRNLGTRMDHVEALLTKGLSVKVTDMPPVQLAGDKTDKADKKTDRKADKQ